MLSAPKKSPKRNVEIDDEDDFEERPVRRGRREEPEEIDDDEEEDVPARKASRKPVVEIDDDEEEEIPRSKKRKPVVEIDDDEEEEAPVRKSSRKPVIEDDEIDPDDLESEEEEEEEAPVRKSSRKSAPVEVDDDDEVIEEDDDEAPAPRGKKRKPAVEVDDDEEEEEPVVASRKSAKAPAPKSAAASVKNGEYTLPKGSEMYEVLDDGKGRWVKGELTTVARARAVIVSSDNNDVPVSGVKDKKGATHIVVEYKESLYVTTIESLVTASGKPVKIAAAAVEEEAPAPRSKKSRAVEPEPEEEEIAEEGATLTVADLNKNQTKALNAFLASLYEA